MPETVNELQVFQGGARVPAVSSGQIATDSAGNLVASLRSSVVFSTASIAAQVVENDNVTIYKAARILKVATNRPTRVRAYGTSAYRTADAARLVTQDPTGDHGCLLEVVTASGLLAVTMSPAADVANMDGPVASTIYFAVQNLDTVTGIVTVTLTVQQEE